MTKQLHTPSESDLNKFRVALINWYGENHRKLPWRETANPYYIWVSEVMLQQTQVKKVLEYYPKFIQNFPDIKSLAGASLQEVLKNWENMGYYARARNLHKAALLVMNNHGGKIPQEYNKFKELPGVGDYIAAAVMSIAFNQPYPVLDGNVKRVLSRLLMIDLPVNEPKSLSKYREESQKFLDKEKPGMFNQAMMELGATICRPRNPRCHVCPVSSFCGAYRLMRQSEFPQRVSKKTVPHYYIAVGVVQKDGKILITRRKPNGLLGGLWEFPGGKVKENESAQDACLREILEEVNLNIDIEEYLTTIKHAYTHFKITVDVFICKYLSGDIHLHGPDDFRWITINEINDYPFPKANHKFFPELKSKLV